MKAKIYVINEGTPTQFFGISFYDGEEWKVSLPYKQFKTRSGAEKAISKRPSHLQCRCPFSCRFP